jgi:hypothetical protein
VRQIVADKAEVGFLGLQALDAAELLNGFRVVDVAANAINRIGRVDNKPSFAQHLNYLQDAVLRRIIRMDAEQGSGHKAKKEIMKRVGQPRRPVIGAKGTTANGFGPPAGAQLAHISKSAASCLGARHS